MWSNYMNKAEQEFGESFVNVLMQELPTVCERTNARVRQSLSSVLDDYIEHELRHNGEILNVLLELSAAECDVEPGVSWFKNASGLDSSYPLLSQPLVATSVIAFIAACAVVFYSHHATKAPATERLAENKEVTAVAARSQIDTDVTMADTSTSTSADQPTPAPTVAATPAMPTASEIIRPTGITTAQKKTAIDRREHETVQSGSPLVGKYPFARRAEKPGFYYSPYSGRVYDLHNVTEGGLVRDPDTGQLFRRPGQKKRSEARDMQTHQNGQRWTGSGWLDR
jgi:hypothetical protein